MRWLLILLIVALIIGGFWLSRKAFSAGRSVRRGIDDKPR
jgi:hypothetical protein